MRLVLWDTDGDFGHRIFDTIYPAGASAAIIVADASRPTTLTTMAGLALQFAADFPGRPFICLVNKIDLAPAKDLTLVDPSLPAPLFASARTGVGVAAAFHTLGREIWRLPI